MVYLVDFISREKKLLFYIFLIKVRREFYFKGILLNYSVFYVNDLIYEIFIVFI